MTPTQLGMNRWTGMAYEGGRLPPFAGSWRGAAGRRWHPLELVAMVVGFALFWPVGLAVLAWKKWSGAPNAGPSGQNPMHRGSGLEYDTGNSAFEDFKRAELARLEEERRKLGEAQAEFGDFLDRLQRARDREEFERFMTDRNASKPLA
jgi:hypothetical protein